jgi:hypothetical protein
MDVAMKPWGMLAAIVLATGLAARAQTVTPPARLPPAPVQPLPFSHRQHAEFGLDCRDCHVNPDPGTLMTYPANEVCMSCHRTLPAGYPALQKLAALAGSGAPIPWVRVYTLPDYVYWDHRTHVEAGIGCETCHGPVADRDVLTVETDIVTMRGCQSCHEKRQVYTDCGDCHEPQR